MRANPPRLKGTSGRGTTGSSLGTCVPPGPANSPGRNRWRESSSSSSSRTSGTVEDKAHRLSTKPPADPRYALRNPTGHGRCSTSSTRYHSSPTRKGGREGGREKGERPERGAPTRRCFASLLKDSRSGLPGERAGGAAGRKDGRAGGRREEEARPQRSLLRPTPTRPPRHRRSRHHAAAPSPAAVRTVSREATSRHSREGGSRPSKKAQGRRNVRSTRRWNHGRIAIATKTSLLAAVFLDPRAK